MIFVGGKYIKLKNKKWYRIKVMRYKSCGVFCPYSIYKDMDTFLHMKINTKLKEDAWILGFQ